MVQRLGVALRRLAVGYRMKVEKVEKKRVKKGVKKVSCFKKILLRKFLPSTPLKTPKNEVKEGLIGLQLIESKLKFLQEGKSKNCWQNKLMKSNGYEFRETHTVKKERRTK
jgi:hypothetical protein